MTPIRIDLDDLLGSQAKASEKQILWEFVLKMMNRFYDDREIWRRYGWALRLKGINPRKEMFSSLSNSFRTLTPEGLLELTEDIHELSRRLKSNGP